MPSSSRGVAGSQQGELQEAARRAQELPGGVGVHLQARWSPVPSARWHGHPVLCVLLAWLCPKQLQEHTFALCLHGLLGELAVSVLEVLWHAKIPFLKRRLTLECIQICFSWSVFNVSFLYASLLGIKEVNPGEVRVLCGAQRRGRAGRAWGLLGPRDPQSWKGPCGSSGPTDSMSKEGP